MARYQVQGPDGVMHIIEGPDNASPADIEAFAAKSIPAAAPGVMDRVKGAVLNAPIPGMGLSVTDMGNAAMGAVRGAGSIGNALLTASEQPANLMSGKGLTLADYRDRSQGMTDALGTLGADTNSGAFKGGKLLAEGAGTMGAGGALSRVAAPVLERVAPSIASRVVNALATNGLSTGAPAAEGLAGKAGDLAIRSLGGGTSALAQGALADPEHAGTIGAVGAALPGVMKIAGAAGGALTDAAQSGAQRLMLSALKAPIAQRKSGEAAIAAQTLLDEGINPTAGGVEKLKAKIADLNDQIKNALAGSSATVDPRQVVNALGRSTEKFGNQVAPTSDLVAIDAIKTDFLNNGGAGDLPVQLAQKLKQGTYSTLKGKYGEMGSASTEAQKDLARGLKEQIAAAVPAVGPLNAEESRLLSTLSLADRRALMDANKNPVDLGSVLAFAAGHPGGAVASLANSSAWAKAMAARGLNAAAQMAPSVNALAAPAVYRSLPRAGQRN